jgi:hypothetical protein
MREQQGEIWIVVDSGAFGWQRRMLNQMPAQAKARGEVDLSYANTEEYFQYRDHYIEFIKQIKDKVLWYANLDVIGSAELSRRNLEYMRAHGLDPLQIWHSGTEPEYLNLALRETDYLAIGGIADPYKRKADLEWLFHTYLCDPDYGYPLVQTHGFGMTSPRIVPALPWFSVDSSSWAQAGAYGKIYVPQGSPVEGYRYHKPPLIVRVSNETSYRSDHIDNLLQPERNHVLECIEANGFTLASLSDDLTARQQWNGLYYTELGVATDVWVYLAGGFEAIGNPEVEASVRQSILRRGWVYCRMVSFYDYPKIKKIITLGEGAEDD